MDDELWPALLRYPADPPVVQPEATPSLWLLNAAFGLMGMAWIVSYLMAVRRAHLEKVVAVPFIAVCSNVAWEFVYAFVFHIQAVTDVINVLFTIIDAILLVQVFRYGRKDAPSLSPAVFNWVVVGIVAFGLAAHTASAWDFADRGGYNGWATTLFTSVAFVLMLHRRGSTAGQTMYIAVIKMTGTLAATVGFAALYPTRMLMWVFYVTMTFFDVLYVILLYRQFKAEGVSPWRKI